MLCFLCYHFIFFKEKDFFLKLLSSLIIMIFFFAYEQGLCPLLPHNLGMFGAWREGDIWKWWKGMEKVIDHREKLGIKWCKENEVVE